MSRDQAKRFEIFRGADAPTLMGSECMSYEGETPNLASVQPRMVEAMSVSGDSASVPYQREGMSLARAWFKSGFPLPLHTHDSDCLYYIIAGSVRMGTTVLGAGDGFFVGADVPYAYTAGPEGVEILEFRTTNKFNIVVKDKPVAAWEKVIETMRDGATRWGDEVPPSRHISEEA